MPIVDLQAEDLRQRLRERPESLEVVDVRQPAEYALVHIRGSKLIPLDQFEARWREVDWAKEVVFVCRSGARSRVVAHVAAASGRDVGNLRFGIFECYRDGKSEFLEGSLGGVERYF